MDQGGDAGSSEIKLTFGEVESRLARMHEIASDKRTQFQARLRNFQKLGLPEGVGGGRGKTVHYRPGHVVEWALALELTQLGLLPERLIEVVRLNKFPIFMAIRMAAQQLETHGGFLPDKERSQSGENMPTNTGRWWASHDEADDPMSLFLFFDPTALASLTDIPEKYEDQASATFFYGGPGIVRENIVRWTAGPHIRRLALVNVTAMIWGLINRTRPENQKRFLSEVIQWADAVEEAHFAETVTAEMTPENTTIIKSYADVVEHADLVRSLKGVPPTVSEAMIRLAKQKVAEGSGQVEHDIRAAVEELELTDRDAVVEWISGPEGMPRFVAEPIIEKIIAKAVAARQARGDTIDEQALSEIKEAVALFPEAARVLRKLPQPNAKEEAHPFDLKAWLNHLSEAAAAAHAALTADSERDRAEAAQLAKDGQWGDIQLRTVLETYGLSEHCDFAAGSGDVQLRSTVLILVPGNQRLVVDAAVPLNEYQSAFGATDPEARTVHLAAHAKVMRAHVKMLSSKAYRSEFGSPDYVVMFVPGEHFLTSALEQDAGLWDYAFDRNVLIASPANLIQIARTIAGVWKAQAGVVAHGDR